MARRKKSDGPAQGTLFGPADIYGGTAPTVPAPAEPPQESARWDDGLTPPTAEDLAALHAAHPGALLLFRHPRGCAFHGADAGVAHSVAGLPLCGPAGAPYAGWRHGDFPGPMRKLLRAGHVVCVVERGEGLPRRHRLDEPVITEFTEVPEGEEAEGG